MVVKRGHKSCVLSRTSHFLLKAAASTSDETAILLFVTICFTQSYCFLPNGLGRGPAILHLDKNPSFGDSSRWMSRLLGELFSAGGERGNTVGMLVCFCDIVPVEMRCAHQAPSQMSYVLISLGCQS